MSNNKLRIIIMVIIGFGICATGFAKNQKIGKNSDIKFVEFITGENSGFYYTIKKGDTLWGLSKKFYNSQWDWPGLWEMNDDIKNPHQIYPGQKIRLFLRKKTQPEPIIVKVQSNNWVKKNQKSEVPLPSFMPSIENIGFIKKKAQISFGSVIKEEENNLMMSVNDIVYIKPSGKGMLIPGKIYQIFTTEKIEEQKIEKQENDNHPFTGVKHQIKAQIKILAYKTTYAKALITQVYHDVNKGDMVMEYYKRDSILMVEDNPDPIDAKIICSENGRIMINDYTIAFINVGEKHVQPGQIYTILRKNNLEDKQSTWPHKKKKNPIELENLESGKLIVLHTEDIASTVMILSSKYAVNPNDIVN